MSAKVIVYGRHPKHVALTFDDGPTLGITDAILDILKKNNVPATFFVIGKKIEINPRQPYLIQTVRNVGYRLNPEILKGETPKSPTIDHFHEHNGSFSSLSAN